MTYVFELNEVRTTDGGHAYYEVVRHEEVYPVREGVARLCARMREWALHVLAEERCDVGLYHVGFGALLDEDEKFSDNELASCYIAWNGDRELDQYDLSVDRPVDAAGERAVGMV